MTRIVLICLVATLVGCGGKTAGSTLPVVASTNVYGDIARQIGGSRVSVTSVLSDPNADPHLFEPGTANGLAVSRARVVIQNGLDYDSFMSRLERSAPSDNRTVVTIGDVLGIHGQDANPHLWYDVPRLDRMAGSIAAALERADPRNASAYRAGLSRFEHSLDPLRREVATIRSRHPGAPVGYTEPVPGYLVTAAGLHNLAPEDFTRPLEQGTEPTPAAVSAMNELVAKHRIRALLYNSQAVSPITGRLRNAARSAGIPVVPVTETLPPGLTFQQWQLRQAKALAIALEKQR